MAKTIILTDVAIEGMFVDVLKQTVTVTYTVRDSSGKQWGDSQTEIYWATLPTAPRANDVQLPATYLASLTDLYNAAKAAISAKVLS